MTSTTLSANKVAEYFIVGNIPQFETVSATVYAHNYSTDCYCELRNNTIKHKLKIKAN